MAAQGFPMVWVGHLFTLGFSYRKKNNIRKNANYGYWIQLTAINVYTPVLSLYDVIFGIGSFQVSLFTIYIWRQYIL